MHGYDPTSVKSRRRGGHLGRLYSQGSYFTLGAVKACEDRFSLSLHIHPNDSRGLEIAPRQRWNLAPWTDAEDATEQERLIRKGTLAFLRESDILGIGRCPIVRMSCAGGWGTWISVSSKEWLQQHVYVSQALDVTKLLIPETRIEVEGDEVALVIDPRSAKLLAKPTRPRAW